MIPLKEFVTLDYEHKETVNVGDYIWIKFNKNAYIAKVKEIHYEPTFIHAGVYSVLFKLEGMHLSGYKSYCDDPCPGMPRHPSRIFCERCHNDPTLGCGYYEYGDEITLAPKLQGMVEVGE